MKDKIYKNRFTLQFNPDKPLHKSAIQILNCLGRRKSDFVAELIESSKEQDNIQKKKQDQQKSTTAPIENCSNEILEGLEFFK